MVLEWFGVFAKVKFRNLIKFSDRNGTQLSFDQNQGFMHFKSKSVKHCMTAMAMVTDSFAQLFSNEPEAKTGFATSKKLRQMDFKNVNKMCRSVLCVDMDRLVVSLLTGSYGGLTRVLEAVHCTSIATDVGAGTIQVEGSDKRVAEVTRILCLLLSSKTMFWSIMHQGTRGTEVNVAVGKQYRDRAKKVLVGEGAVSKQLQDIEKKSGATLKFEVELLSFGPKQKEKWELTDEEK